MKDHEHNDHTDLGHIGHQHRSIAEINFSIITVSDTRTLADDKSGTIIETMIKDSGHSVINRSIVKDEPDEIRSAVGKAIADKETSAIILTGGTGITARDNTPDTIAPILEKELTGFGELFRYLSYDEIGSRAILSRALAGTLDKKIIFCLPGSAGAVKLAMEKLILPDIGHILWEVGR